MENKIMESVEDKEEQQILEMGKKDAGGNLEVEEENETGSSHQESSINMDSAYESGNVEDMLNRVKADLRKENGILLVKLQNEEDENDNLRQKLENNSKEKGFLMVKLENAKDENVELKEEIIVLKDDIDKYKLGRVAAREESKRYIIDNEKLKKEIVERNQDSEIEDLKEEINKLKENKITQKSLDEHELLKIKYQETEDALHRVIDQNVTFKQEYIVKMEVLKFNNDELNKEKEFNEKLIKNYKEKIENMQTNDKSSKEMADLLGKTVDNGNESLDNTASLIETNRVLMEHVNSYKELSNSQKEIIETFKDKIEELEEENKAYCYQYTSIRVKLSKYESGEYNSDNLRSMNDEYKSKIEELMGEIELLKQEKHRVENGAELNKIDELREEIVSLQVENENNTKEINKIVDLNAEIEHLKTERRESKEFYLNKFLEEKDSHKEFRTYHEKVLNEYEKEKEKYISENLKLKEKNGNDEQNVKRAEINEELHKSKLEIQEMSRNIRILNERNFKAEMKISKTRKYIRHCEREQKEIINHGNNAFRSLENKYFNVRNAYNKDTAFLNGKCNTLENNLRNARRRNEDNIKLKGNLEIAEQNAWMLIGSLKDERRERKNYENELHRTKESLKGKQEEMEKIKEDFSKNTKEIQENGNPGNEIKTLKKMLEINEKKLVDKEKKLVETVISKENARKNHEKYRRDTDKDLKELNQLHREALMGNSLNEKEKKHFEFLKSEERKMQNNDDTRCQLEEEAKEHREIMMNLRGQIIDLEEKLRANRNNECESNVRNKRVVPAKSLENFIRSSGIKVVGSDGSNFKSIEIRNKNDLKSPEEKIKEAISFYKRRMDEVHTNSGEYHSCMSSLNKLQIQINEIERSKEEERSEEKNYSLQVPCTLGLVSWVAPPQRFQNRCEDIQQEEVNSISEVIAEQNGIYNSLGLQGSEEQGGATALEENDGYYMPRTDDDYYFPPTDYEGYDEQF